MGSLYVVATPIGNLDDISTRAKSTLKKVDAILCEDTRRTLKLLNSIGIKNNLISLNKDNEVNKIPSILKSIESKDYAIVSDSGTPGVSDPGNKLIKEILENNQKVIPIPGPSAVTAAYSASGMKHHDFLFYGFPPRKKKDLQLELHNLKKIRKDLIFFESPNRVENFLNEASNIFKNSNIVIFRELTKIHEEILLWKPKLEPPVLKKVKGEFVIIIERELSAPHNKTQHFNDEDVVSKLQEFIDLGFSGRDAIENTSQYLGLGHKKIYNIYVEKVLKKKSKFKLERET
ncbi:MAG: 16S rRNA (cytidine(1402)-2'-O)-methyltransferase [Chloroflexota bacterium]|tara:strand:+ start:390 stop:1256 length:867 start_codon:yes stop_codon:yes gene_type:complete